MWWRIIHHYLYLRLTFIIPVKEEIRLKHTVYNLWTFGLNIHFFILFSWVRNIIYFISGDEIKFEMHRSFTYDFVALDKERVATLYNLWTFGLNIHFFILFSWVRNIIYFISGDEIKTVRAHELCSSWNYFYLEYSRWEGWRWWVHCLVVAAKRNSAEQIDFYTTTFLLEIFYIWHGFNENFYK